jgi:hypothetical protein
MGDEANGATENAVVLALPGIGVALITALAQADKIAPVIPAPWLLA